MLRSWDVWASGASKRNIKLYPPLTTTSRYFTDRTYMLTKANIYVLQSESPPPSLPKNTHTHTTNPSLATLPGWSDNTRHGFMASWLLQWDAWIQTRSTHTLFRPCAFFCSPPRARPRREGEQATQQKPVGSAAAILLQSVCTHLSGSEGKRKGTVRDPRSVIKGMCFHACVCVCVKQREREASSYDTYPCINNPKSSTWIRPHPASSLLQTLAGEHIGRMLAVHFFALVLHRKKQNIKTDW